jgi:hypothetical protein
MNQKQDDSRNKNPYNSIIKKTIQIGGASLFPGFNQSESGNEKEHSDSRNRKFVKQDEEDAI